MKRTHTLLQLFPWQPISRLLPALLVVLLLTACSQGVPPTAPAADTPASDIQPTLEVIVPPLTMPTQVATLPTPDVNQFTRSSEIIATGAVAAAQDAELVFQINGTVEQVLVEDGSKVQVGDLLAVLDTRTLDQAVRDAEAALVSAQADLAGLDEPPTNEASRAAQALVDQAVASYNQVVNAVSPQDIAAAQAALAEAQENLNQRLRGADPLDIQAAQNRVDQARVQLQSTRDQLSQAKTQAELAMQQAAEQVRIAQTDYSAAYWDWRYVEDYDRAPPQTSVGGSGPPLSDFSRQAYRDRLTQTEIALNTAYGNLEAAEKRVEQARLDEINGVRASEEQLRSAEIALSQVLEPTKPDIIAQAQARVAQAEAALARLVGPERQAQIAIAQAQVDNARANLDRLNEAPRNSDTVRARANVERARSNLERALLNREYANLKAPFAGEVARVNIDTGDAAPTSNMGGGAIRLVDLSTLYVELNINDVDIARVSLGQPAVIVANAIPGRQYSGKVVFISPTANKIGTVTNYLVKVQLDENEVPLRVGMEVTATLLDTPATPTPRSRRTATPTPEVTATPDAETAATPEADPAPTTPSEE